MRRLCALRGDRRGATLVEFAIVLPVMLALMLGLGELAYQAYVQAILTGAVQKAGRDATIQGNATQTDSIDAKVKSLVKTVAPGATFVSQRANFDNYAAIAGEPFIDSKYPATSAGAYDGICNHGESYTDVNSNGRYDTDLSQVGEGGANDVAKYTMSMTYSRIFPLGALVGLGSTVTLSASTILKNQPYAAQTMNSGVTSGTCA